MVSQPYVPKQGDFVWHSFVPQVGREQRGRRPALVLSPDKYNEKVGLMLCCPVTSQVKGYPFEVDIPDGCGVSGVILSDQVKSLDWKVRAAEFAGQAPQHLVAEVLAKLTLLLEQQG